MSTAPITGITGMVGSHLTDYLLDNTDREIVGLARWRSPLDSIEHHLPPERLKALQRVTSRKRARVGRYHLRGTTTRRNTILC